MEQVKIIEAAVTKLMKMFRSGEFPAQLATTIIRKNEEDVTPSGIWSIVNRILMTAQNTGDASGYNQWQEVGRQVKKGSKAICIFGYRYLCAIDWESYGNRRRNGRGNNKGNYLWFQTLVCVSSRRYRRRAFT